MKQTVLLWILAFIITVISAVYQRVTGPTFPLQAHTTLAGEEIHYTLERSHGGGTDCPVSIIATDHTVTGYVEWKHYPSTESWVRIPLLRAGDTLTALLPHQPPAGKLEYRVALQSADQTVLLPAETSVVIRFKGDVPTAIILTHILFMFGGMMLSTRAGIEFFRKEPHLKKLTTWTLVFLIAGGFALGPVVQWYAFGKFWTGWPIGHDLTDNKTALAIIAWIIAAIAVRKARHPARWALTAAIITFVVYLIPHSVLGSELDRSAADRPQTVSRQ